MRRREQILDWGDRLGAGWEKDRGWREIWGDVSRDRAKYGGVARERCACERLEWGVQAPFPRELFKGGVSAQGGVPRGCAQPRQQRLEMVG